MDGFVARENIKHYRHLLETETDALERARLLRLLAEEEIKLRSVGERQKLRAAILK